MYLKIGPRGWCRGCRPFDMHTFSSGFLPGEKGKHVFLGVKLWSWFISGCENCIFFNFVFVARHAQDGLQDPGLKPIRLLAWWSFGFLFEREIPSKQTSKPNPCHGETKCLSNING